MGDLHVVVRKDFLSRNVLGRTLFPFPNSLQDIFFPLRLSAGFFFPPKVSVQVFIKCINTYIVAIAVIVLI